MLFNSYVFLILFLPVTWCVYFGLGRLRRGWPAQAWLLAASFCFYGYGDWRLCILLLGSICLNYLLHRLLVGGLGGSRAGRCLLAAGILANLGLLFYFKYFNFVLQNFNRFLGTDFVLRNIALPLGISFFTFQQISFLIDSGKPGMKRYGMLEYALFVAFFPQLVAGPIVLHQEMIPQFADPENRRIRYGNMIQGLEYLILGFAKKVLVADVFARICDAGYENLAQLNSLSACATILAFTLEIYFDFSGYCDMAMGLGRLFNIRIPVNFDSPYKAVTIADFWKRWHITLTRFLTTYLYIPLGGNRRGMARTCLNIAVVFTLSGLWHGADWNFVLWGMLHGAAMILYRLGRKWIDRLPGGLLWCATFLFVNVAWVFFRAEYFRQAFVLLRRVFVGGGGLCQSFLLEAFSRNTVWMTLLESTARSGLLTWAGHTALAGWFLFWTLVCVKMPSSHQIVARKIRSGAYFLGLGILFVWSFLWLSRVSKFIYFNF